MWQRDRALRREGSGGFGFIPGSEIRSPLLSGSVITDSYLAHERMTHTLDCAIFFLDLMRRQEELRRMEELHNQEVQKRKQLELRYLFLADAFSLTAPKGDVSLLPPMPAPPHALARAGSRWQTFPRCCLSSAFGGEACQRPADLGGSRDRAATFLPGSRGSFGKGERFPLADACELL